MKVPKVAAATRAGALDPEGRQALLRYLLRPPVAQERLELRFDGLVRIVLKKAYAEGTVAVATWTRCRCSAGWPPACPHRGFTPSDMRACSPRPARGDRASRPSLPRRRPRRPASRRRPSPLGGYRPWAELLARTFGEDVLACPKCQGRMKLIAMVKDPASIARYLAAVGEATQVPRRSQNRGPPYWKSRLLRRLAAGDEDGCHSRGVDEAP